MINPLHSSARALKAATASALLLGLAACATPAFKADVSRFQSQLPAPSGQTFAVVAEDPKLAGSSTKRCFLLTGVSEVFKNDLNLQRGFHVRSQANTFNAFKRAFEN